MRERVTACLGEPLDGDASHPILAVWTAPLGPIAVFFHTLEELYFGEAGWLLATRRSVAHPRVRFFR